MIFECELEYEEKIETWKGKVTFLKKYASHYEMRIESRSSLLVLFGETSSGGFACIPDFSVGCHLAHLKDRFWNTEKLTSILGDVDGITVATALYKIADEIKN